MYYNILYFRNFFYLHLKYYFKKCNPKPVCALEHYYNFFFLESLFFQLEEKFNSVPNCPLDYCDKNVFI